MQTRSPDEHDRWSPAFDDGGASSGAALGAHAAARYRHFRRLGDELRPQQEDEAITELRALADRVADALRAYDKQGNVLQTLPMTRRSVRLIRVLHELMDETEASSEGSGHFALGEWEASLEKERLDQASVYDAALGYLQGADGHGGAGISALLADVESDDQLAEVLIQLKQALLESDAGDLLSEEVKVIEKAFTLVSYHCNMVVVTLPADPELGANDTWLHGWIGEAADTATTALERVRSNRYGVQKATAFGNVDEASLLRYQGAERKRDIPDLIEQHKNSTSGGKFLYGVMLAKLAEDDNVGNTIYTASGTSSLLQLLRSEDETIADIAGEVLIEIAEDDSFDSLATSPSTFAPLSKQLEKGSQSEKEQAAILIMKLSKQPILSAPLLHSGMIPLLLNLVQDEDDGQQRRAAAALWNLLQSENCRPQIVSPHVCSHITKILLLMAKDGDIEDAADIMRPVSKLIGDGSDDVGEIVLDLLHALIKLESDTDYTKAFRSADGIQMLVKVIDGGQGPARRKAVGLLEALTVHVSDRRLILSAGGMRALLAMAQSACQEDSIKASQALKTIEWTDRGRSLPVLAADIEVLVAMICSNGDTDDSKLLAMSVLYSLFRDEKANKKLVAAAGGIPLLISIVRDCHGPHRLAAVKLLKGLGLDEDNEKLIGAEGGIPVLVDFLRGESTEEGRLEGTLAVQNVSIVPENKVMIAAAGGIDPLIQLMCDSNSRQRYAAICTLFNIAGNADNRRAIIASSVIPRLEFCYRCDTTRIKAVSFLKRLSMDEELPALIVAQGAVEPLVTLIGTASGDLMTRILDTLTFLAMPSNNKPLIASVGVVPQLIGIVRSSDRSVDTRTKAANVLRVLMENENAKTLVESSGGMEALEMLQSVK